MARRFKDMTGRQVDMNYPPQRIVSLVPSQTELLYDLGLDGEVVGITKFCVHPQSWFRNKTRIGGTKTVNFEKIASLQPDLILANKEENTKEQIEELAQHYSVWVSEIQTVEDGLRMIREVGLLTDREEKANSIAIDIAEGFAAMQKAKEAKRVAYFIWRKPWMSIGGDTFISDMIKTIGWQNVLADKQRYPEINLEELALLKPEMVLLSSEPYPFKERHINEIKEILPDVEVKLVDGEMFSWYGSRMLKAVGYMEGLLLGKLH